MCLRIEGEMKKALIINLKGYESIFYMAHTIRAIKNSHPYIEIYLLVLKEYEKAAWTLQDVQKVFSISRNHITSILKSQIFCNSIAINYLSAQVESIQGNQWDYIYNYSNDDMSAYLTSYLALDDSIYISGSFVNKFGLIQHSNDWANSLNNFILEHDHPPFPLAYYFSKIASSNLARDISHALYSKEKHDKKVHSHFSRLRGTSKKKIVGIAPFSYQPQRTILEKDVVEIINGLNKKSDTIPVIIHGSSTEEKKTVKKIKASLKDKISAIECDVPVCISAVKNVDILITADNALKHIADMLDIPSIEVSLADAPFFKQSSLHPKSLILTAPIYEKGGCSSSSQSIPWQDIILACRYVLFCERLKGLSKNIALYRMAYDNLGTYLKLVYGRTNVFNEITRTALRFLIYRVLENKKETPYSDIFRHDSIDINDWLGFQKEAIASRHKNISSILEELKEYRKKNGERFFVELESLLTHSKEVSLAGFCLNLFSGHIENLTPMPRGEGFIHLYKTLNVLKNNLNIAWNLVEEISVSNKPRVDLIEANYG